MAHKILDLQNSGSIRSDLFAINADVLRHECIEAYLKFAQIDTKCITTEYEELCQVVKVQRAEIYDLKAKVPALENKLDILNQLRNLLVRTP